jgi:hypothetical protein
MASLARAADTLAVTTGIACARRQWMMVVIVQSLLFKQSVHLVARFRSSIYQQTAPG